jgi:hypothetical protein
MTPQRQQFEAELRKPKLWKVSFFPVVIGIFVFFLYTEAQHYVLPSISLKNLTDDPSQQEASRELTTDMARDYGITDSSNWLRANKANRFPDDKVDGAAEAMARDYHKLTNPAFVSEKEKGFIETIKNAKSDEAGRVLGGGSSASPELSYYRLSSL